MQTSPKHSGYSTSRQAKWVPEDIVRMQEKRVKHSDV